MQVVVTGQNNRLIACIDTDGEESILVSGAKHFIAPKKENIAFIESEQGVFAYPQIVLKEGE